MQVLGTPEAGPGYTGHVNDPDSGLVYMQARYYDPINGRFLSADSVDPSPGNLHNFNRYEYALSNPVINTDPDGRESVGEMINSGADGCGPVSCAGWAALSAIWTFAGAEPVSQIADKGWSEAAAETRLRRR
ncbi:RHS repeat-associated core domain-containing protein [Luteibacter sp. Lutesp34]|uniref:RHS repeat-associated core domain-containing protein n=1 Tax=Luteibacter sp. Lutesp34 TaxID=3243030 RepID=UPI0039B394BC